MAIGQRARTGVVVMVALAGLVGLIVFVATRPGPDLAALRADPVARWVPAGGTLTRTHESRSGTTLGMPVYARVTRVFSTPDPDAALEAAAALADSTGWQVDPDRARSVRATRHIPSYRLQLTVVPATVDGVPGNLFLYLAAYPA
jgi:hypothetical protein